MINDRSRHSELATTYGRGRHAGALAAGAWLSARGLSVAQHPRWEVAIALDVVDAQASAEVASARDTRFHIAIAASEWGFYFCHHSRASWIRVTDVPFIHERDDFELLPHVPPLRDLGQLVQRLEAKYRIQFRRKHASIKTTLPDIEQAVRIWCVAAI